MRTSRQDLCGNVFQLTRRGPGGLLKSRKKNRPLPPIVPERVLLTRRGRPSGEMMRNDSQKAIFP